MIFFDPAAVTAATFSRNALASWPTVMRPLKSRITMPSCSRCWISWLMSDGHLEADHGFDFLDGNHFDGIPRAAVQEGAVRPPAGALLAADAEHGVHVDAAEGRMILVGHPDAEHGVHVDAAEGRRILVGHPIHAIGDGAIRHAGRRTGATGAAFGDDGKFLGPLFARGGDALRLGLHLDDSNGGHAGIMT